MPIICSTGGLWNRAPGSLFVNFKYFLYDRYYSSGQYGSAERQEDVFLCIPGIALCSQVSSTLCLEEYVRYCPFYQFIKTTDGKRYLYG